MLKKHKIYNFESIPLLLVLFVAILGLSGAIVFIVIETSETPNRDLGECIEAHEGYNFTSQSTLGIYSRYAVAADSKTCSTIGK